MDKLLLPSKVEWHAGDNANHQMVVIEPCFYGYGMTLGNALRRVLLSSLPGSAVTAVQITGVDHEFSSIDYVAEDVVEILLNLKRLRVRSHSAEPIKLTLKVKGEKEVTGADFEKNAEVEVVNPDLKIATITDKKGELEMTITIEQGRGYITTENQDKSRLAVGEIAVDAIFSPVINVGYKVDDTRVGQVTDYDKLTMHIETDGIITPQEAFSQSVEILLEQFGALKGGVAAAATESATVETEPTAEAEPAAE